MKCYLGLIRQLRCSYSLQLQVKSIFVVNGEGFRQQGHGILHCIGKLHIGHPLVHLGLHCLSLSLPLLGLCVLLLPHC